MFGLGRTAEPVAAPQGHFLILFSTIFTVPVTSIFLLLVQKKGIKEKDTRKLVGFPILIPSHKKKNRRFANSGDAPHLIALKHALTMILFYFRCSAALDGFESLREICINKKAKVCFRPEAVTRLTT